MSLAGTENVFLILSLFKNMGLQVTGKGYIQGAMMFYMGYIQIFIKLNNSVKILIIFDCLKIDYDH